MKSALGILIALGIALSTNIAFAQQRLNVGGAAGGCVSVSFSGSCGYPAQNNCARRVRIHLGSSLYADLNPGQSHVFANPFGGCLNGFVGPLTADYL